VPSLSSGHGKLLVTAVAFSVAAALDVVADDDGGVEVGVS